jgi:hypothetical protein
LPFHRLFEKDQRSVLMMREFCYRNVFCPIGGNSPSRRTAVNSTAAACHSAQVSVLS